MAGIVGADEGVAMTSGLVAVRGERSKTVQLRMAVADRRVTKVPRGNMVTGCLGQGSPRKRRKRIDRFGDQA